MKINIEKSLGNVWKYPTECLIFAPAIENETYSERQRGSLKSSFEKKSSERFGRDAKMSYLCTTFRSERALKTFEVFLKKIWKVRKKGFTFATAFRFEK